MKEKFFYFIDIYCINYIYNIALLLNRLDIIDLGTTRIPYLALHNDFLNYSHVDCLLLNHNYSYSKTLWLYYLFTLVGELSYFFFYETLKQKY